MFYYFSHMPRIIELINVKFLKDFKVSGSDIPHKVVFEKDQVSSKPPFEELKTMNK